MHRCVNNLFTSGIAQGSPGGRQERKYPWAGRRGTWTPRGRNGVRSQSWGQYRQKQDSFLPGESRKVKVSQCFHKEEGHKNEQQLLAGSLMVLLKTTEQLWEKGGGWRNVKQRGEQAVRPRRPRVQRRLRGAYLGLKETRNSNARKMDLGQGGGNFVGLSGRKN